MDHQIINEEFREKLDAERVSSTDLRAIAKAIGKNHTLAQDLWAANRLNYRLAAVLIMDPKKIDAGYLETLVGDIETLAEAEQEKLSEWLLANQLMHIKTIGDAIEPWSVEKSVVKQRMFWSYQARKIRKNKQANSNSDRLLAVIEKEMENSHPTVQWTMNWCAAEIGIFDETQRERCIALGERLGLYKDYPVSKGCTSPYLPIWINAMVGKK